MMEPITLLGLAAGAITTISFVPQVLKTWRSKSAKDVSLGMFGLFAAGIILWIIYGFYTRSMPIIAANTVTLALVFVIIGLKFKYGQEN